LSNGREPVFQTTAEQLCGIQRSHLTTVAVTSDYNIFVYELENIKLLKETHSA